LFLLYINNIVDGIGSRVRLFADDCLLYKVIDSPSDANVLQKDLDRLCEWARTWQMSFNPGKCSLLRVTKRKSRIIDQHYTMMDQTLTKVDHHPYLGVELAKDLSWSHHINNTTRKAHNALNFLRRNISKCSRETKAMAYKSMVRSNLEYANAAWYPYNYNHIEKTQSIQNKAARFVMGKYGRDHSVTEMQQKPQWPSLQARRFTNRICLFRKALEGHVALPVTQYAQPNIWDLRGDRQRQVFHIIQARDDPYKFSFFPKDNKMLFKRNHNVA
jgi:hypothetical protein